MAAEFGLSATSTRAGPSGSTVAATAGERHSIHKAFWGLFQPGGGEKTGKDRPGSRRHQDDGVDPAGGQKVAGLRRQGGGRQGPVADDLAHLYAPAAERPPQVEGNILPA